jgi:chromosomal replication initiator protein
MVADISTPDSELKTAICVAKARKRGVELSNTLAFSIASHVDNIRSLEGKLQQIIMTAQTEKTLITPELVAKILKIPIPTENRLDARAIIDKVCEFYNLPMKLIKGEKRDKPIVVPRQIIMYLLKNKTSLTYEEIAANIGRRDHTTIVHGVKKIAGLLETDERVRQDVDKIVDSFASLG